jgi:hypothetical protein
MFTATSVVFKGTILLPVVVAIWDPMSCLGAWLTTTASFAAPKTTVLNYAITLKNIDNISTWTNAFLNYTSVLLENHPSKTGELIQYISIIRNVAEENPTCRWLVYDQQIRLGISRNPTRAWNSIDGELWMRFIATSIPPNRTTHFFLLLWLQW